MYSLVSMPLDNKGERFDKVVGTPDNRITVLYEHVLTPQGNILDHSRYLNRS